MSFSVLGKLSFAGALAGLGILLFFGAVIVDLETYPDDEERDCADRRCFMQSLKRS